MSLETFKQQLEKFVSTEIPEVIAIKGDWGVGKTYGWNKLLLDTTRGNRNIFERYSYISLFGINSLDSLKFSIFENIVDRELIGEQPSVETLKKSTTSLLKRLGRKSYQTFKASSIVSGFNPAIQSLFFLSLNKVLICIDDLERRGCNLEIKDIMGLVSLLKEKKNCKIVLLLNENEEGSGDYEVYKEKVIDIELEFSPTSAECASIAYEKNDFEFSTLAQLTQNLNIRNIRVLKKIERLVELAIPLMREYEEELQYQVIHSLSLYSWCYYCSRTNGDVPTIDYVTNISFTLFGIGEKEDDEEKIKWNSILQSYGYKMTGELDLVLAQAVKSGYFTDDDFHREATKKNKEILASKSENSFHQTWRLYHNSFDDNEGEVVNSLYNSLKENVHHVSLTNLNGTVTLFRELGYNDKASEIIDYYAESRRKETGLFNLNGNNFFWRCKRSRTSGKIYFYL